MKTNVMLAALLLGTSIMANANTTPTKPNTSKEVKTTVVRKHKKDRKAKKVTEAAKPVATAQK